MPDLSPFVLPALYVGTAALTVAVAFTQAGAIPYFLTVSPVATLLVIGTPIAAGLLGAYPFLIFIHIIGAFVFVGAHAVSVYVAFQVPSVTDGAKAEALLMLSGQAVDGLHAGLGLLIVSGIAAGFVGGWWDRPWIWLSLDLLLAITAYMYVSVSKVYTPARHALVDEGGPGWDENTRLLVSRRKALELMVTGSAALLVIVALMVVKP